MPELLRHYIQGQNCYITLREGEQPQPIDWLNTGAVDFIVTYNIGPGLPADAVPLARFPAHALIPASDSLALQSVVSLAELAARPLVLLDLPQTSWYLTALFQTETIQPRIVLRTRSYDAVRAAVACGFGSSVLNMPPIGLGSPDSPLLARRPISGDLPAPTLVIADIYGGMGPAFVRDFIALARSFFQALGPSGFAVADTRLHPTLLPALP